MENTLRDKAKYKSKGGQLPDGAPALCAISLGDVTPAVGRSVAEAAAELVRGFSALSGQLLFWSERDVEDLVTIRRRQRAQLIRNEDARLPLRDELNLPRGLLAVGGITSVETYESPLRRA